MKFYSIILSFFFIYLPKHFALSSFLQTKLENPTQSQNGGGDQMYDRVQQAAEHIFLPFSHKMTFFEHQNPYAIYPTVQDELKAKKKANAKVDKDHSIYHKSLDNELYTAMKSVSNKIKYSNINTINKEEDTFQFKLNPEIGTENENDTKITEVLEKSRALAKENEQSKTGKLMDYAGTEYNKSLKQLEDNGNLTVGQQLSVYDLQKLNLNLSEEFLNQNVMIRETSKLDSSEKIIVEKDEDNIKELTLILNNRTKAMENEENSYLGMQSVFPGNKQSIEFRNKTYYNGWIHPHEIPYFDKLYMDGYYDDILER
jgi:hypothetical protein